VTLLLSELSDVTTHKPRRQADRESGRLSLSPRGGGRGLKSCKSTDMLHIPVPAGGIGRPTRMPQLGSAGTARRMKSFKNVPGGRRGVTCHF
jgi:hypothetical protein